MLEPFSPLSGALRIVEPHPFQNKLNMKRGRPVNKIYFPADALPAYIDWDGSPIRTKQVEHSDICYIRKDALVEWANKRLEEFRHIAEISNDVAADGEVDAFEELIDKLNEM